MLLEKVNSPEDIRGLGTEELRQLCGEIRQYIVDCCAVNPGHLGSSLGAVELIVGLHYVFNTPSDKIVFDVGHQAYAHKIITGRREAFKANRTREGISGFPSMKESGWDAFGTGHASTSISAALGLAHAAKMQGREERCVAFIGDGAMTGGMAFEGLNNAADSDLLIILNDNDHSIDDNIGSFHEHLLRLTTSKHYNKLKSKVWQGLGEGRFRDKIRKIVKEIKSHYVGDFGGAVFESLGLRYFGPIDGNDIEAVVNALGRIKDLPGPKVLHAQTVKGKGYAPAEADKTVWHAPGKFNPVTGERISSHTKADRYQDVFGQVLLELARQDSRVVGITPAMATGCGMTLLASEMPERFFDVGIEEEHAVTFSAGLAAGGMRPFCNIYSSFSQRAYDQIIHDVALQELPVVLCFDRAGVVGEDGPTHQGSFDLAAYRSIPGVVISAPRDEVELKQLMYTALQSEGKPFIIRYPRGCGEGCDWRNAKYEQLPLGKGSLLREGTDIAILALGTTVNRAIEAAGSLSLKGIANPAVYDLRYLKPIDENILEEAFTKYRTILTVEDGCLKGGLFSAVCEYAAEHGYKPAISGLGIPDVFITQDSQNAQRNFCGIDTQGIEKRLLELIEDAVSGRKK